MTTETELRADQFATSLSLALADFKAGDYANALYWLDGAKLIAKLEQNHDALTVSVPGFLRRQAD